MAVDNVPVPRSGIVSGGPIVHDFVALEGDELLVGTSYSPARLLGFRVIHKRADPELEAINSLRQDRAAEESRVKTMVSSPCPSRRLVRSWEEWVGGREGGPSLNIASACWSCPHGRQPSSRATLPSRIWIWTCRPSTSTPLTASTSAPAAWARLSKGCTVGRCVDTQHHHIAKPSPFFLSSPASLAQSRSSPSNPALVLYLLFFFFFPFSRTAWCSW